MKDTHTGHSYQRCGWRRKDGEGGRLLARCGRAVVTGLFFLFLAGVGLAQRSGVNYDETKVPSYTLPDPLAMSNGQGDVKLLV